MKENIREWFWVISNKGKFVFKSAEELTKFKTRGDSPRIEKMGSYFADANDKYAEGEVWAAMNAESRNQLDGVAGGKAVLKKDQKYFKAVRRQKFGGYFDNSPTKTFKLSKEQMAYYMDTGKMPMTTEMKEIKPVSNVHITDLSRKAMPYVAKSFNATELKSKLANIKVSNTNSMPKVSGIVARTTPLPVLGWEWESENMVRILQDRYHIDHSIEIIAAKYPLDVAEIMKARPSFKV